MRMNDAFARVSYNFRHRKGTLKVGDSIQTRGKDLIGYGLVFGDNVGNRLAEHVHCYIVRLLPLSQSRHTALLRPTLC